jgi:hypothetical protein
MNNVDIELKNLRYMDRCFQKTDELGMTVQEFWDELEASDFDFEVLWGELNEK